MQRLKVANVANYIQSGGHVIVKFGVKMVPGLFFTQEELLGEEEDVLTLGGGEEEEEEEDVEVRVVSVCQSTHCKFVVRFFL